MDCCPITDGAAAAVLAVEEKARELTDKPLVYLRGAGQCALHSMSANMPNWTTWESLKVAAEQAYKKAKIGPKDVNVAMTHDCFTISEIIEMEDLGFCEKGEGGDFIASGANDFGGQVPTNTDGGLLGCGHPFGGTGIRQGIEVMKQLRGDAIQQVPNAAIGLTHNLSGFHRRQHRGDLRKGGGMTTPGIPILEGKYMMTMDLFPQQSKEFNQIHTFYEFLREGRFTTTKCTQCGAEPFPPRVVCPECYSEELEWIDWPTIGTVIELTEEVAGVPLGFGPPPLIHALVDLEGKKTLFRACHQLQRRAAQAR